MQTSFLYINSLLSNTRCCSVNKLFYCVKKLSLSIFLYISFSRLDRMYLPRLRLPLRRLQIPHEFVSLVTPDSQSFWFMLNRCTNVFILMCSCTNAHPYSTSICDLLLFLITEWSQSLVTIFIQAQLLHLYSFYALYYGLPFYIILSVSIRVQWVYLGIVQTWSNSTLHLVTKRFHFVLAWCRWVQFSYHIVYGDIYVSSPFFINRRPNCSFTRVILVLIIIFD